MYGNPRSKTVKKPASEHESDPTEVMVSPSDVLESSLVDTEGSGDREERILMMITLDTTLSYHRSCS